MFMPGSILSSCNAKHVFKLLLIQQQYTTHLWYLNGVIWNCYFHGSDKLRCCIEREKFAYQLPQAISSLRYYKIICHGKSYMCPSLNKHFLYVTLLLINSHSIILIEIGHLKKIKGNSNLDDTVHCTSSWSVVVHSCCI